MGGELFWIALASANKKKKESKGKAKCVSTKKSIVIPTTKIREFRRCLNAFNKLPSSNEKFTDVCNAFNDIYNDLKEQIKKASIEGKERKAVNSLEGVKILLDNIVETPSENSMKIFKSEVSKSKGLWFPSSLAMMMTLTEMNNAVKKFVKSQKKLQKNFRKITKK